MTLISVAIIGFCLGALAGIGLESEAQRRAARQYMAASAEHLARFGPRPDNTHITQNIERVH